MEQKITKRMMLTTLALAFFSIVSLIDQKGIEDIKGVYIISLLARGFTIGAAFISLMVFIKSKKTNDNKKPLTDNIK